MMILHHPNCSQFRREWTFSAASSACVHFRSRKKSKSHRLKPVLLNCLGPFLWLQAPERPDGNHKFLQEIPASDDDVLGRISLRGSQPSGPPRVLFPPRVPFPPRDCSAPCL